MFVPILGMLASCATAPAPKVIRIPQDTYVAIPPALTEHCPLPKLADYNGDVLVLAHALVANITGCYYGKLDAIRAVQGSPAK